MLAPHSTTFGKSKLCEMDLEGITRVDFGQIFVEALDISPTFVIQSENGANTHEYSEGCRHLNGRLIKENSDFSGHVFHKHCVPEAACVLCFHQNLTTLGTTVL